MSAYLNTRIYLFVFLFHRCIGYEVKVFGPGLHPVNIVMPARYFFVNFTGIDENL